MPVDLKQEIVDEAHEGRPAEESRSVIHNALCTSLLRFLHPLKIEVDKALKRDVQIRC